MKRMKHNWIVAMLLLVAMAPMATAIEHDKPYGEPYKPAGKRIVFTTWYWVRPGQWDWLDNSGKSVYANDRVKAGPYDAHFTSYDAPRGIRLIAEPAQRVGPIIQRTKPWEKMGLNVYTIIRDQGKFRAWGSCQDAKGVNHACYFESTDGRNWTRPDLGLVEYDGNKHNNLIAYDPVSIMVDPIAPPEERYKSMKHADFDVKKFEEYKKKRPWSYMAIESDPGRVHSIRAAVSADGLTWKELPEPISVEPSDTQVTVHYNPELKKYVMYTRSYLIGPRAPGVALPTARVHQFLGRRAIGRSESKNFRAFPLSQVIIEPGPAMSPTDTYYTNCFTTIPGAPDGYVMFPAIYQQASDNTRIELFTSDDDKVWHQAPGPAMLRTDTFGKWDGGVIFAHPNLIELADGTWALPYTGYRYPHKYPRGAWSYDAGYMTWPKGRLMALEAPGDGSFATPVFIPPGKRLLINAVTQRTGQILVEAADLVGKPLPGHSFEDAVPIIGDQYRQPVKWKNAEDLGVKEGEPVMLRFRMKQAKIYGLDFD